jgi:hypothetical protein
MIQERGQRKLTHAEKFTAASLSRRGLNFRQIESTLGLFARYELAL